MVDVFCGSCKSICQCPTPALKAADALAKAAAQNNHLYNEMGEDLPDCKLCAALSVYDKVRNGDMRLRQDVDGVWKSADKDVVMSPDTFKQVEHMIKAADALAYAAKEAHANLVYAAQLKPHVAATQHAEKILRESIAAYETARWRK